MTATTNAHAAGAQPAWEQAQGLIGGGLSPAPDVCVTPAPLPELEHIVQRWANFLELATQRVQRRAGTPVNGTLTHVAGLVLESVGLRSPVGAQCWVGGDGEEPVLAEVVGFANNRSYLMPAGDVHGLRSGLPIRPLVPTVSPQRLADVPLTPDGMAAAAARTGDVGVLQLPLGLGLLGRVVDAQGKPLDGLGPIERVAPGSIQSRPINAMHREPVREPLDTGIKAINALLTVGRGQRIGLFAGSGVGKSVLLGMMARHTRADVVVVGLIGERGREVKEFIEDILGVDERGRAVVVAAPADASPLLRMQGAAYASAIAEHYREQGLHVLLLMDSLTRYAMAQREIALAIGEPPSTKGYPPSCFARLAKLVERSGNGPAGGGSVTGIYTVLSEGDDQQDPIADSARSFLDGHIVLSRRLAESGHYPAIDVLASASRVMHSVVPPEHTELARRFRAIQSTYEQGKDLVQLGAYVGGSDPALDDALARHATMMAFLQQGMEEGVGYEPSVLSMASCLAARADANGSQAAMWSPA